jgi:catechol 2,3-dioxygenase-like lactoylglutathione lyase family enzyme
LTTASAGLIVVAMPRLDHAAFETDDPDATAGFYERVFGARIVKAEGHPVMAYVGNTGFAFHERGGPGDHVGVRVSDDEREELKRRLDEAGIEWRERDHGVGVGLFFEDPDGRQLEAITYYLGDDPRRR